MKIKAIIIAICLGFIALSGLILVKSSPSAEVNLGMAYQIVRDASVFVIIAGCILMTALSTRLRIPGFIGILLIFGTLAISFILSKFTGQSIGTPGWISAYIGILLVIPLGILLCAISGIASILSMIEEDNSVRKPVLFIAGTTIVSGILFVNAAGRQPDIYPLIDAIKNSNNAVERTRSASSLFEIQDLAMAPPLIALLKDNHPEIRSAAALALSGRTQAAAAVSPLITALTSETDKDVREWMIRALANTASVAEPADRTRAVDLMIKMLREGEGSTKGVAAESLGRVQDKRAVKPLIAALNDPDADFFAHGSLIQITGQRLDRNPELWQKWLESTGPEYN